MQRLCVFIALIVVTKAHFPGGHTPKVARWCCVTGEEMLKCHDLAEAAFAVTNLSVPMNITCVRGANVTHCMSRIFNDEADLVTLSEADIYRAGKEYGLLPVVGEDYGQEEYTSYFVVALVLSSASPSLTLKSLRGSVTCHPRAGDTAGWQVPIGFLIEKKMLPWKKCNTFSSAGAFFEKSCVPGAFSTKYDPDHDNPSTLCGVCEKSNCPGNKSESFYGYNGSYTCLVEKKAHVAFVRHTTVFDFTGVNNQLNPGLDFKLLCPDGSRKDVGDYELCSLARIPARVVMTRDTHNELFRVRGFRIFLLELDRHFRKNRHLFQLFKSRSYGGADLLFQDSTVRLVDVSDRNTTDKWLGKRYKIILDTLESCDYTIQSAVRSSGPIVEPFAWSRVLLCLFICRLLAHKMSIVLGG